MLLWEFLLRCDKDLDLSDGERALAWLKATAYFPHFEMGRGGEQCEPPSGCWVATHAEFFRERLLALRSLAARLKGFKSREPRGNELVADVVLKDYVRYRTFRVAQKRAAGSDDSSPRPLDRCNFDGLKLTTERPSEAEEWLVGRWKGLDTNQEFVLLELDKFFASAFVSMVSDGIEPICGRCGRELEPTPKGRKPRAKFCKACQFAAWQDAQTDEQKRERWKRDKRQQRGTDQQPKRRK
jgi:hypothetical protein